MLCGFCVGFSGHSNMETKVKWSCPMSALCLSTLSKHEGLLAIKFPYPSVYTHVVTVEEVLLKSQ